ncbi:MAG: polysaccharide deacetylase family protein [Desulfobacteraceae bacterium]|nr:polysaccharide deacetylase family protein [Desulfobacteraceae bacterium]
MRANTFIKTVFTLVVLAVITSACTGRFLSSNEIARDGSAYKGRYAGIVTVKKKDTLASLAQTYLKDAGKAWWIAQYNGITDPMPGQKLVIPYKPPVYGGLQDNGYQMVPILLYHSVAKKPRRRQVISIQTFTDQMDYLRSNGYVTIGLDQLLAFVNLKDAIPARSVVVCFDSEDSWVYKTAYSILKKRGMKASVFVSTKRINKKGRLSWKHIMKMAASGWNIGSKGVTGQNLTKADKGETARQYIKQLEREIKDSKKILIQKLKKQCLYFAYPQGGFNDLIIALLKKHGYQAGFIRSRGSNPFYVNNFKIRLTRVDGSWDKKTFRRNLKIFQSAELK